MAKDQAQTGLSKAGKATGNASAPEAAAPKKSVSPAQFVREVRAEARKITWPSRKETWITTVMVFMMVVLAAVFFGVTDLVLGSAVKVLTGLGR